MGGKKKKHWKCKSDKNLTITLSVNKPILISDLHTDLQDGDNIHLSLYLVKYHQPETVEVTHDSPPLRLQLSCTLRLSQFSTTSTADKMNEKHNIRTGLGKLASHFKIQGLQRRIAGSKETDSLLRLRLRLPLVFACIRLKVFMLASLVD